MILASQGLDQLAFRRIVLRMASTTHFSRFTSGLSRCPAAELTTEPIDLTTVVGVPVTTIIISCGRDCAVADDATTAVQ